MAKKTIAKEEVRELLEQAIKHVDNGREALEETSNLLHSLLELCEEEE